MEKTLVDWVGLVLVIVGGLNWGLVGILNIDLVQLIFGTIPFVPQIFYILFGLSALYTIYFITKE